MLQHLKSATQPRFSFFMDGLNMDDLPSWVRNLSQLTDGHLVHLAATNKAILATLDRKIPGSFLIPDA